MDTEVAKIYGNKVRIRACGLLIKDGGILLVNHKSLTEEDFWSPPGGGIEFGETVKDCITREYLEETGLVVEVLDFRFACEYVHPPLHALELFFMVKTVAGTLVTGMDPEMNPSDQIIQEVKFVSWNDIKQKKQSSLHAVFRLVSDPSLVMQLNGYFTI